MRMQVIMKNINLFALFIYGKGYAAMSVSSQEPTDTITLDEQIVTAVKPTESITGTNPFFKLDNKQILHNGVTDISDALHRLPGVTLRDYGGAGGMKTVSVRGLGAAHTAVIYDGLPLTDIQKGAIDLSRYSVDNLSSLELVIGDNNEIFLPVKSAASPASLSISTPLSDNRKKTDLTFQLKAGSFGYVSPYIRLSQKFSKDFTLGFSGEYIHTDNNYPFKLKNGNLITKERRENNKMNSGHVEINTDWKFHSEGSLSGKVYYYDNDRELPGPVLYYNVSNNHERLRDRNIFAQADFIQPFAEKWKLRIGAKFNWAGTFYTDFSSKQNGEFDRENYFQREYYATTNLLYKPSGRVSFDYSIDYSFNNLNSNLKNDAHPGRNALLQSFAVKLSLLRVNLVARIIESLYFETAKSDKVQKKNYSRLSPAISLNFKPLKRENLYVRISYKNIFRMPSFSEAYFHHFGSPDLKPESTDQIDFGVSFQKTLYPFMPIISITADVYKNRVKDRIVAVPYNMFLWTITNLNSVNVLGADLTLNTTFYLGKKQQLLLSGTWSYQRAKINVPESDIIYGKQVADTPLNSGSFSLSYENPWVNAVLHGQGTSAKYAQNSNIPQSRLSGYFEFGFTLWKEFNLKNKSIEIRCDLLNIFDRQYVIIARYPMPGRSFMASVKFKI